MSDNQLPEIPADRIEFYNRFANQTILSAIQAIDDSVEERTGNRCDHELRQKIADILSDTCKEYFERLKAMGDDPTAPKTAPNFEDIRFPGAVRISTAITDSLGQEVFNPGFPIWLWYRTARTAQRALTSGAPT